MSGRELHGEFESQRAPVFPWTLPGEDGGVCFVVIKSDGDQLSAGHRGVNIQVIALKLFCCQKQM